jgi:GNAT superfamily N-acetyltransferase
MKFRSVGLASDALVMQGQSVFEDHSNRIVMRTPDEPNYWHGNLVIMKELGDPVADVGHFVRDFPDATHSTVVWDVPDLDPEPLRSTIVGHSVDTFDVLTLRQAIRPASIPDGIDIRPVRDWDALCQLQSEVALEEGYDTETHTPFLIRRNAARRAQIEKGMGQWFVAYDGDVLVASMGLFHDTKIARYQSVETRTTHRRRGICAAMLAHTCTWVLERAPDARPVIVAEADSAAGRLYRRMGFALTETMVEVIKRGD